MRALGRCLLLGLIALTACSPPTGGFGGERRADLIVGAFDFDESRVMAAIYSGALERAGISTEVLRDVASRELMEPALEQGRVDVVPEYEGTALHFLIGENAELPSDPEATHDQLVEAFASRGVTVLEPSEAENKNELVVTQDTADRYDLHSISDLKAVASKLSLGGPPECIDRPLCVPGWRATYGIKFQEFTPLDAGGPLTVGALVDGDIDVAVLFSTTPAIHTEDLVALDDDQHLQPAERLVPVIRTEAMPEVQDKAAATLDRVSAAITTQMLRELNDEVSTKGRDPDAVASHWLDENGF